MVVWFSAGHSLTAWIGPVLRFAWPIVVSIALLALFVTPWANAQIEESRERFEKARRRQPRCPWPIHRIRQRGSCSSSNPSTFSTVRYATCLVARALQDREGLIVAARGVIEVAKNGDRFLALEQGRR